MTREEEIDNASYAYWVDNYANIEFIDEEEKELHTQDIQDSFINGAEWADAHPDIDVRTMAAWQSGYKEAIDKACEWLSVELDKEEELHYIHVHGFDKERREIFLEELKKAMKGGNQ